jgi:uncharacterized protein YicC (UPF0701 family)
MKKTFFIYIFVMLFNYTFTQIMENKDPKILTTELISFFEDKGQSLNSSQKEEISKIYFMFHEKISSIESDTKMVKDQKKEVIYQRKIDRNNLISKQLTKEQNEKFKIYSANEFNK